MFEEDNEKYHWFRLIGEKLDKELFKICTETNYCKLQIKSAVLWSRLNVVHVVYGVNHTLVD